MSVIEEKPLAEWVEELFCSPCKTERPFTVFTYRYGSKAFCDYCDNPVDYGNLSETHDDRNELSYDGGGYE